MTDRLESIKARRDAATPGPWYWGGNLTAKGIDLRARISNTPIVMAFRRWGNGGEPCFWKRDPQKDPAFFGEYQRARDIAIREVPYRDDVARLDNADAEFIARSREDIDWLISEVDTLRLRLEKAHLARIRAQNPGIDIEQLAPQLEEQ